MKKNFSQINIIMILLSTLFVASCSGQEKRNLPDIFALRRNGGITHELIRISPPNYTVEYIELYSVFSYDIAHNSEMIVYSSFLYGNETIVVIPANTGGFKNIIPSTSFLQNPSISPSDDAIVYEKRENIGSDPLIAISDINFTNTITINPDINAILPSWSPDGKQISMFTPFDNDCPIVESYNCKNLCLYSLDLKEISSVIKGPINSDYPIDWNQEQNKILYSKWVEGKYHLFTFDLESKTEEQLTQTEFDDVMGSWSKDGKIIAFTRKQDNNNQLCFLIMGNTKCFDQSNNTITGISWINDTSIIYGTYDLQKETTKIVFSNAMKQDITELATYSGYLEDFKTYRKNHTDYFFHGISY